MDAADSLFVVGVYIDNLMQKRCNSVVNIIGVTSLLHEAIEILCTETRGKDFHFESHFHVYNREINIKQLYFIRGTWNLQFT